MKRQDGTGLLSRAVQVLVIAGAVIPPAAKAGGLGLYEIATPDVGLASAGYAARAQDPSTVFTNPAGMTQLRGTQFQLGGQLTYGNVEFSKNSGTGPLLGDENGGNSVGALPAGSLFVTHAVSERVVVGFASLSYFGLAQNFKDDWVGRYYIQDGAMLGLSFMPSVSLKATDWLSVGAGLNAMYGYLDTKVAVRTGGAGDGQLEVSDEVWGFGANLGLLLTPRDGTRIGLTYMSPVTLNFEDRPSFKNLGPLGGLPPFTNPPRLDLGLTVPQSVMLSVYQQLNPKWALLANAGWQNWSEFGKVDVGVDSANPQSLTTDLHFQDTWHGAVGVQYRASEKWLLSAGFAYDSSAVSDEDRTLSLPMGEAYRIGVGAEWKITKAMSLGASYEFMWAGDMPVTQESAYRGRVSGEFADSWFSFVAVNMRWKF